MIDQKTYCENIEIIRKTRKIPYEQMSREAGQKSGFAAKSKDPRSNMSVYRLLAGLHRNHGVHAPELFVPPVQWRGDGIGGSPSNPHIGRPTIKDVKKWMESVGADWKTDPMLSYMTVFHRPPRAKSKPMTAAMGRMSLLAIEGGITTPEQMDVLMETSREEFIKASTLMVKLKIGELVEGPPRQQTLYVPPDNFVTCVVSTIMCRKGEFILHYANVNAHALKRDSEHNLSGGGSPVLLETKDFERQ